MPFKAMAAIGETLANAAEVMRPRFGGTCTIGGSLRWVVSTSATLGGAAKFAGRKSAVPTPPGPFAMRTSHLPSVEHLCDEILPIKPLKCGAARSPWMRTVAPNCHSKWMASGTMQRRHRCKKVGRQPRGRHRERCEPMIATSSACDLIGADQSCLSSLSISNAHPSVARRSAEERNDLDIARALSL